MTEKHLILIESAHIKYQFEIKRNLTIIHGAPVRQYQKNQLSAFYLEGKNKEQILCVFPKQIQNSL